MELEILGYYLHIEKGLITKPDGVILSMFKLMYM